MYVYNIYNIYIYIKSFQIQPEFFNVTRDLKNRSKLAQQTWKTFKRYLHKKETKIIQTSKTKTRNAVLTLNTDITSKEGRLFLKNNYYVQ